MFNKKILPLITGFLILTVVPVDAVENDMERLGMKLYKDKNLSFNGTQSCQNCHHPFAGFADITNAISPETKVVSTGADGVSTGGRNAPSAAYAGFSPTFELIGDEWVGGMFWDGRAEGATLGDPLAEQAQGPPLNPVEMAMDDKEAIIKAIKQADYATLWYTVFGPNSLHDVEEAYDNFGRAIAAYERSTDVTKFTSRYDLFRNDFTDAENRGQALFESNCATCHSTAPDFGAPAALFTNYRYANIGSPANPLVPLGVPDLGLGVTTGDTLQNGKFKIPTLRNIASSAPYSHNGFFSTLESMVGFINDRSSSPPEVNDNISTAVGNLGLTQENIDDIVAFLHTLTDIQTTEGKQGKQR